MKVLSTMMMAMVVVGAAACGGAGEGSDVAGTSPADGIPQGSPGSSVTGTSGGQGSGATGSAAGEAQPTAEDIVHALTAARALIDPSNTELLSITDAMLHACETAPASCLTEVLGPAAANGEASKTPKFLGLPSIDWTCLPYKALPTWWVAVATLKGLHATGILSTRARCDALVALGSAAAAAGLDGSLVYQALLGVISATGGHCACKYAI